jgi:hypothetical protein
MSKVKIQGNASGTGVLTVTAPNTSTDRTITLPDSTGTLATTADTGVAGITSSADATAITIDSSEKVNIGETGTPYPSNSRFHVKELTGGNYVASFRHDGNSDDSMGIAIVTGKNTGSSGVVAAQFKDGDGNDVGKIYHTGTGLFYNTGATGGIEFTNGGAANTLDDYEEGSYTVSVSGSTSGSFNMAGNDTLAYTKIGRLVTIQGYIGVQSGSVGGNVRMSLPFAPTNLGVDDQTYNFPSVMLQNQGHTIAGQKYLFLQADGSAYLYRVTDAGSANYISNGDVDGNFEIGVSFTYISG